MMEKYLESSGQDRAALHEALMQMRKEGGKIAEDDSAVGVIVKYAEFFPQLDYLYGKSVGDDAALRANIRRELETRPEAFIDEILSLS